MNFFSTSTSGIILYCRKKVYNLILWTRNKLWYLIAGEGKKVIQILMDRRSGLLLIYSKTPERCYYWKWKELFKIIWGIIVDRILAFLLVLCNQWFCSSAFPFDELQCSLQMVSAMMLNSISTPNYNLS